MEVFIDTDSDSESHTSSELCAAGSDGVDAEGDAYDDEEGADEDVETTEEMLATEEVGSVSVASEEEEEEEEEEDENHVIEEGNYGVVIFNFPIFLFLCWCSSSCSSGAVSGWISGQQ